MGTEELGECPAKVALKALSEAIPFGHMKVQHLSHFKKRGFKARPKFKDNINISV